MRTRNQKTDKKILRRGLSLYRTKGSPYWYARIWNSGDKKYVVRSTKETSRLVAEEVAEELINDLKQDRFVFGVPRDRTFNHYAELLIKEQRRQSGKTKNARFSKDDEKLLNRDGDGIIEYFGRKDVATIKTLQIREYLNWLDDQRSQPLASSTKNKYNIVIKKVLGVAYEHDAIDSIPPSPEIKRKDNPLNEWGSF